MIHYFGTLDEDLQSLSWSARKAACYESGSPRPLWIYLLTPGFTLGYHQHVLGISSVTLARHITIAKAEQAIDPTIHADVQTNIGSITAEDGLAMARRRGAAHLPFWSRLAICEYLERLGTANKVAKLFGCSPATVTNMRRPGAGAFDFLSVSRRLTPQQQHPAGQWRKSNLAVR